MVTLTPYDSTPEKIQELGFSDWKHFMPTSAWHPQRRNVHFIRLEERFLSLDSLQVFKDFAGLHLEFTAPETVRNLWIMAAPRAREKIFSAHMACTIEGLLNTERWVTRAAAGIFNISVTPLISLFPFRDNQKLPELKTHALVSAFAPAKEGRAFMFCPPKESLEYDCRILVSNYRAILCHLLEKDLGLDFKRGWLDPQVVGVPENLRFSEAPQPRKLKGIILGRGAHQFIHWQREGALQGWGAHEGKAVLQLGRMKQHPWFITAKRFSDTETRVRENLCEFQKRRSNSKAGSALGLERSDGRSKSDAQSKSDGHSHSR